MTSQKIKFYKFNNSTGSSATKIATAKATEGAVIYLVDVRELWIGGSTPKLVIKGANDVTFDNNVLTLTHYDNAGAATTQTLDFSDVASASSTMAVFEQIYTKMGLTGESHSTLDYTGTNYLTSATNLVDADKALDTAIHTNTHKSAATGAVYDTEHLSSTWTDVVTDNTIAAGDTLDSDIDKLDTKVAGLADEIIANEQVTQEAFTTVANSVGLESDMTLDLRDASETGAIHNDTDVKSALIHLDNAISTNQLDVQVDGNSILSNHVANINTEDTYDASTNKLATKATVTNAINALDVNEYEQASVNVNTTNHTSTLKIKGIKEVDGKIAAATTTPTSDVAIDGEYDATDNKIATKSTVTNAINALDVTTDKGTASISGSTITINAVQQENGLIKDGGSTTINLDGTYDATDNKIATESTVTTAIEALDATNIQGVDYTAATSSTGAKLTFKGVSETDGKIAQGTGATELQFAKVATTGAAADVSYTNSTSGMTATDVQAAIDELDGRVDSLVGGMRYNGDIDSASATVNTTTGDVRPGDIYLAKGAFTIGSTSVEAGDMIVYKGTTSKSDVALTASNCTIIERETDTMVTAGDTLADDYIVFGNGTKEVTTTSTVDSANYTVSAATLKDAITKANSALQSISHGTDGTYVTTTVGSKDSNNDQTVGVEVAQSTVTYTAKDGDTPANLTATNGLLNESAITPIKNYVDAKVGTAIQSVDGSATEKGKNVTQSDYAAVKVTATTDANNNVTLDSAVGLTIQAVSTSDPSSAKGLAEASDVKSYVDGVVDGLDVTEYAQASVTAANGGTTITVKGIKEENGKIDASTSSADTTILADGEYNASNNKLATQSTVTTAISGLDADITSDDAAVATVKVVETDGKITDVVVTNVSAGVSYTASDASTQPGLTATNTNGAVTGGDIAAIKSYVDDKVQNACWEEYE